MSKIVKMSTKLANMIAAGEVVERPSNVVKELVENSIDAKSTNINIYLVEGGLVSIKVADDGEGMDKDDVLACFNPHSTSKIKNEYDLFRITTLGFRGEAIPSIASVSKMSITASADGISGYNVTYKSGIKVSEEIVNSNKGCTVEVCDLFFNTPARLKYMKSAKTELASIMFYINRIAMSHPTIRFTVYHDNKKIFSTSGSGNFKNLIGELYGLEAAKNVIEHSYSMDGYKAHLVFVKPSIYRANKLEMTLICNNRYVKNYNITNTIVEGFSTYLPISKYPIGILYFDIDPTLVDVNVHPTKSEIKIANEEDICSELKKQIIIMLTSNTHIPTRNITQKEGYVKESIFDIPYVAQETNIEYTPSYEPLELNLEEDIKPTIEEKIIVNESSKLPYMEYVGTVFGTYLIFQNSKGMYLVDQHAAAERYNYEKYYKLIGETSNKSIDLLVPALITLSKNEALYVEQTLNEFSNIGFSLEQAGDTQFIVRTIPLWCKIDNVEDIIYEILSAMIEQRKIDVMYFRDKIAKSISCKASIKANQQLSRVEIDALMKNLGTCENPYTCPHGRPVVITFSTTDLEKMFERIQK